MGTKKTPGKGGPSKVRKKYARPTVVRQGTLMGLAERVTGANNSP